MLMFGEFQVDARTVCLLCENVNQRDFMLNWVLWMLFLISLNMKWCRQASKQKTEVKSDSEIFEPANPLKQRTIRNARRNLQIHKVHSSNPTKGNNNSINDFHRIASLDVIKQPSDDYRWTIKLGWSSNLINNIYARQRCLSNNETSFSVNGHEICEWNNKFLIWMQVMMNFWWTDWDVMVANDVFEANF